MNNPPPQASKPDERFMTEQNMTKPDAPKSRKWLKIVAGGAGGILLIIVVLYFVGTSAAFFRGFILPKVSASLNAKVTVSDASISPFSEVSLKNLKVETTGADPLFAAAELRARYSLWDIIGGHINVEEVALVSPVVTLIQNADGTGNLDPILKSQPAAPATPQKAPEPAGKPLLLNLKKVALTDGVVRVVANKKGGDRDTVEINSLNFTLENVANNQSGKITVGAETRFDRLVGGKSAQLRGNLNGGLNLALTQNLQPGALQGGVRLDIAEATGTFAAAAGLSAALDYDIVPTQIKPLSLKILKGSTRLGELSVAGPFDISKLEGTLSVALHGLDKNLLNLAGAAQGFDFGPTTLSSTSQVQIAKSGKLITVGGGLDLTQLQVTRTNQTTPSLNFGTRYDLVVDLAAEEAVVRTLNLSGTQKGQPLLRANLTSPMRVWGKGSNALGDSAFKFELLGMDLADWRAFAGGAAPDGKIRAKAEVLSQAGGDALTFSFDSQIENLTVVAGTNRVTGAAVGLQAKGKVVNLKQVNLSEYKLDLGRQGQALLSANGSGTVDTAANTADLQLNSQVFLAALARSFPTPDMSISSGNATLKARVTQLKGVQEINGNLALTEFSGRAGSNVFRNFGTALDLGVTLDKSTVQLRKINGTISEEGHPGGTVSLTGTCNLTNQVTQLKATLSDFNQYGLRTFLEPALGGKQLVSVALSGNATIAYDPQTESSIQAGMNLTNLVVKDPAGKFPAEPLQAAFNLDTTLRKQVTEIKQARVTLKPTARANNEMVLQGKVDMSETQVDKGQTNSLIKGALTLSADALDFTQYYDLFMGGPAKASTGAQPPAASTPATAPGSPDKEPTAIQTPFRNFTMDLKVGRVYLHEIEMTNLLSTLKLDHGKVLLKPCQVWVNGAPVKAALDCDLGVEGFKYAVELSAVEVPFAPLVNSLVPDRKGQVQGTLTATTDVAGAGTTGASLQKNLSGKFDIATTNLNLAISNLRSPLMRTTINIIAIIPDLIKGGGSGAIGALTGALLGGSKSTPSGGLSDDLAQSPINVIQARGSMASGLVKLDKAMVQSPAFQAGTHGSVTLKPVLTNSVLEFPLQVALRRSVAEKINFVPAGTPTNAAYVQLPEFVTIEGTLGEPKKKINSRALLGTALQQYGASVPGTDQKTGNLLQSLGSALTGQKTGTNAPTTSTNAPTSGGLLQGLGNLLGTSAQSTNTSTPHTNQPAAGGLLQGLGSFLAAPKPATNAPAPAAVTNQPRPGTAVAPAATPGKK